MFKAIQTRYLGYTNHKPSRIKAFIDGHSVFVSYDHELTIDENHHNAAMKLANKLKWNENGKLTLNGGTLPNNDYCFILKYEE